DDPDAEVLAGAAGELGTHDAGRLRARRWPGRRLLHCSPWPAGASRCAPSGARIILQKETPRGFLPGAFSFPPPFFSDSRTPAPQPAIASQHELQVVLVPWPFLVLGQLGLLLHSVPALAFARRDLHGFRGVLE